MWTTEMILLLRHMIGDLDTPYVYSDDRLQEVILAGAQFVITEVPFSVEYTIDIDERILDPDPTDRSGGTRDNDFMNLVLLRAGCFIDTAEARAAGDAGVQVEDQGVRVNLTGAANARIRFWERNYCKDYKDTRDEYLRISSVGTAVVGPKGHSAGEGWYYYGVGRYR